MAVKIFNLDEKMDIYKLWTTGGYTKTSLAEMWLTSTRTIGRIIDEMEEYYETQQEDDEDCWEDLEKIDNFYVVPPSVDHEETFSYVASEMMISIIRDRDGKGISLTRDNKGFSEAYKTLYTHKGSQEALAEVFSNHDVETKWEVYEDRGIKIEPEFGRVSYSQGNIHVNFNGRLVERLIEALSCEDFYALDNLVDFSINLLQNPDERAVNELYDFLEASDIEVVAGGMVRCWKRITHDYKDCFTWTIDNSVGKYVSVPRSKVDPDSDRTCSYGLHVCSKNYLRSYVGDVIVSVIVNPKDFVAIPTDYNFTKARVCAYTVEADVTEQMSQYL